jgi:hypothetical protein
VSVVCVFLGGQYASSGCCVPTQPGGVYDSYIGTRRQPNIMHLCDRQAHACVYVHGGCVLQLHGCNSKVHHVGVWRLFATGLPVTCWGPQQHIDAPHHTMAHTSDQAPSCTVSHTHHTLLHSVVGFTHMLLVLLAAQAGSVALACQGVVHEAWALLWWSDTAQGVCQCVEHSEHVHVQPECMRCVPASGRVQWSTAGSFQDWSKVHVPCTVPSAWSTVCRCLSRGFECSASHQCM